MAEEKTSSRSRPACYGCYYYQPSPDNLRQGTCHCDPPKVFMIMVEGKIKGTGGAKFITTVPTVNSGAYCSKHQPMEGKQ